MNYTERLSNFSHPTKMLTKWKCEKNKQVKL